MEANSKRNFLYLGSTILLILLVVGVSYAAFTFSGTGTKENVITTGHIEVAFEEQNNIVIKDRYPESDTEGLANTDENSSMSFTVSGDVAGSTIVNYAVGITEIKQGLNLTQDYIKINLTKNGSPATGFTSDTGKTIGSFKLIQVKGYLSSHVIAQGSITGVQVDTYTLKAWIDENYDLPLTYTENNASHNVTTQKESFSFKVKVVATDTTLETSEKEPNIPNAPELATNMIPVTYDGNNWVKADSTNSNNSWYNYDSKVWANAVTVTEQNRSTYLNAKVGTPISMDDINTMWVWIPRFNATIDGTFCSEIDNVNADDYPECYSYNKVIDLTEEEKNSIIDGIYINNSIKYYDYIKSNSVEISDLKTEVETSINNVINNNDINEMDETAKEYSNVLMLKYFSEYITLSENDKLLINEYIGDEELTKTFVDAGFTYSLLKKIYDNGATIDSNITFTRDSELTDIMCESEEMNSEECDAMVHQLNSNSANTKMANINYFSTMESVNNYFLSDAYEIIYQKVFAKNNVVENTKEIDESGYQCYSKEEIIVLDEYTNRTQCEAAGHIWVNNNPKAMNLRFTKTFEKGHDAFTFGSDDLSGLWAAKFLVSHTDTSVSDTSNSLMCINDTCENAKELEILPSKVSLRNQNVSNMFYASRSMEQNGNLYGLVADEIDTHMMKNSELGAVAYLTLSIYGMCTSTEQCIDEETNFAINQNDDYLTGYGSARMLNEEGSYNTELGMNASTTGNIYGVYDINKTNFESVMAVYTDGSRLWSGFDSDSNSGFNGCLGKGCTSEKNDGLSFPEEKYYNTYTTKEKYISDELQHSVFEHDMSYFNYFVDGDNPWVARFALGMGLITIKGVFGDGSSNETFRVILVK